MQNKFSSVYPPRDRLVNDLGHLDIQIRCAMNTISLDPNTAAYAGYCRAIPGLGEPIGRSALSGTPGFLYRTDEIEVVLSENELIRLFRRDLQPQEVLSLHQKFGAFYETHDDFYDEVTGWSHQPMGLMKVDKFNVRIVSKGDRYGLDWCRTHDKDEPLVEFYDARYPHTAFGQFVSRYCLSTILERDDAGLCLDGGVPEWSVCADDMATVRAWLGPLVGDKSEPVDIFPLRMRG